MNKENEQVRLGGRTTPEIRDLCIAAIRAAGFQYGQGADVSGLWEAIAKGQVILVKTENLSKKSLDNKTGNQL